MDGLYACGPVIRKCREYKWDYMLVFKECSIKDVWHEATALMKLNPEESLNEEYGGRKQHYKWANDIEYSYGKMVDLKKLFMLLFVRKFGKRQTGIPEKLKQNLQHMLGYQEKN